jgi:hypothetical protein
MIGASAPSSPSANVHRSNRRSTIQHQQMEYLSSSPYLSDWPIEIIRIVSDYMLPIQLWLSFQVCISTTESSLMVLNLTSLQTSMSNNTLAMVNPNDTSKSCSCPIIHECKGVLEATSEWSSWGPSSCNRELATYAVIDNILVSSSLPFTA